MKADQDLVQFTTEFFTHLGCKISQADGILTVENVPAEFEHFFGRKGPYTIVFDRALERDGVEVLVRGSPLLKLIAQYMERKGQTTLLKFSFPLDPGTFLSKQFSSVNSQLVQATKEETFRVFFRFTFLTTLSYLNEKEQVIHDVSVSNGEVLNLDTSPYTLVEGTREDIRIPNMDADYTAAKQMLRERLAPRIHEVSAILQDKVQHEIQRIQEHHGQQLREFEESSKKLREQIAVLEKNPGQNAAKIKKVQEQLTSLEQSPTRKKISEDEQFFIQDEVRKHGLHVDTKLMNTTILYYPIFTVRGILEKKATRTKKQFSVTFDPLTQERGAVHCESCKKEITTLSLCQGSHLVCQSCIQRCGDCSDDYCVSCLQKKCHVCDRRVCKTCIIQCRQCGKYACKMHRGKHAITAALYCTKCLASCPVCSSNVLTSQIKACARCGSKQCEKCNREGLIRSLGRVACKKCGES